MGSIFPECIKQFHSEGYQQESFDRSTIRGIEFKLSIFKQKLLLNFKLTQNEVKVKSTFSAFLELFVELSRKQIVSRKKKSRGLRVTFRAGVEVLMKKLSLSYIAIELTAARCLYFILTIRI